MGCFYYMYVANSTTYNALLISLAQESIVSFSQLFLENSYL